MNTTKERAEKKASIYSKQVPAGSKVSYEAIEYRGGWAIRQLYDGKPVGIVN